MEAETEKMKKEGEKLDMLNDQERAKLQDEIRQKEKDDAE